MTAAQSLTAMAALYGPTPHERIARLIEAGDALTGLLEHLRLDPSAHQAEQVAGQLQAMQREAGRLVDALAQEVRAWPQK